MRCALADESVGARFADKCAPKQPGDTSALGTKKNPAEGIDGAKGEHTIRRQCAGKLAARWRSELREVLGIFTFDRCQRGGHEAEVSRVHHVKAGLEDLVRAHEFLDQRLHFALLF